MNHISIKRLQCILLKAALVLGVEICPGVEFREVVEPDTEADSWTLGVSPADHPINKRGLDVLIGAEVLSAPVSISIYNLSEIVSSQDPSLSIVYSIVPG